MQRRAFLAGASLAFLAAACSPMTLARHLLMVGGSGGGSFEVTTIPDPRTYDEAFTHGGGNPIADAGNGLYARVLKSTPGLMQWWRLGHELTTWGGGSGHYYLNSAGASTLSPQGGIPTLTAGLITGDPDGAVSLTSSTYLSAFDYYTQPSSHEIITIECWINLTALGSDTAFAGEWKSNVGWMLREAGADLQLWTGANHLDAAGVLGTGVTHHLVGVIGGIQAPTPDHYSRLYVDGVEVASGDLTSASDLVTQASQFEVNQYGAAGGTGLFAGVIDEIALYSRMLQPDEITQHYQAGLGVLWP